MLRRSIPRSTEPFHGTFRSISDETSLKAGSCLHAYLHSPQKIVFACDPRQVRNISPGSLHVPIGRAQLEASSQARIGKGDGLAKGFRIRSCRIEHQTWRKDGRLPVHLLGAAGRAEQISGGNSEPRAYFKEWLHDGMPSTDELTSL